MAGVINTSSHPKALWPGVKAWWGKTYNDFQTEYTELFDVQSSDKAYEEVVQIVGFGVVPVKAQGASITYDSEVQGPVTRFTHVAYASGYIVTHEELADNLYTEVSNTRASALARSFRQTKERVAAGVYNRATTSGYVGGDGVVLLSTAHPNTSGGTFSNKLAVDADLSEAALEDLTIQIMQATDDRGLTISLMPKSLIVAPANFYNAHRILDTPYQVDTANNNINVLKANGVIPKLVVNHYLTDSDAWFIRTDCPNGMLFFDREPIRFDQDNDFDTMNAKAAGYERYSCGWVDPRALYGSTGG